MSTTDVTSLIDLDLFEGFEPQNETQTTFQNYIANTTYYCKSKSKRIE